MISGATRGAGGSALGRHNANAETNETVYAGVSRGLISEGIEAQIAELTRLGSHARTNQPIYHLHIDPSEDNTYTSEQRARFRELFEQEFGLQKQPFASQIHIKNQREHEHVVYLRTKPEGNAIRMDHDYQRREKIARIIEHEFGIPFTKGAHNKAVIAALEKERPEIAEAMMAAALHEGPRASSSLSPTLYVNARVGDIGKELRDSSKTGEGSD